MIVTKLSCPHCRKVIDIPLAESRSWQFGPYEIDDEGVVNNLELNASLTPREREVVLALAKVYPLMSPHARTLRSMRLSSDPADVHLLRTYVSRMRPKLQQFSLEVVTIPYSGYRLEVLT